MYKGIAANRIVRLNVDGSLTHLCSGTGFSNGAVNDQKFLLVLLWWRDF
jgi:hypothetical protein